MQFLCFHWVYLAWGIWVLCVGSKFSPLCECMWLIYLKIHQASLTKMQPPLHSSFWQEESHSGWLRGAHN